MNASEAGTIKEFLANEEDTVVVGQDLVRIELGGAPAGEQKDAPKEEPKPESESKPEPKQETTPEPKKESAPAPSKPEPRQAEKSESKPQPAATTGGPSLGNREERRVS